MTWSETLMCHWLYWQQFDSETMLLIVPPRNVPDMTGCVTLAKALLEGVTLIGVYTRNPMWCVAAYEMRGQQWVSLRVRPQSGGLC